MSLTADGLNVDACAALEPDVCTLVALVALVAPSETMTGSTRIRLLRRLSASLTDSGGGRNAGPEAVDIASSCGALSEESLIALRALPALPLECENEARCFSIARMVNCLRNSISSARVRSWCSSSADSLRRSSCTSAVDVDDGLGDSA